MAQGRHPRCRPRVRVTRCLGDFNLDGLFNGADSAAGGFARGGIQGIVDALLAGQTCP